MAAHVPSLSRVCACAPINKRVLITSDTNRKMGTRVLSAVEEEEGARVLVEAAERRERTGNLDHLVKLPPPALHPADRCGQRKCSFLTSNSAETMYRPKCFDNYHLRQLR